MGEDLKTIYKRIDDLKGRRQEIDTEIEVLSARILADQLQIQRLRKQKRVIMDELRVLEESTIPDIIA